MAHQRSTVGSNAEGGGEAAVSSNQDEEMDEAFCEQLAKVTPSPALVLMGDFNFPDICWKYNTAQRKQSRRFLECVVDRFMIQLV